MYDKELLGVYRDFVRERHAIWKKRQEDKPQPWTNDPILRSYKFTNDFRVLDPGSQFVLTDLYTDDPWDYLARCFLYRYTNLPKTWRYVRAELGRYPLAGDMSKELIEIIQDYRYGGNVVFSGAYIIMPNPGVTGSDKVVGAVELTRDFMATRSDEFLSADTPDEQFAILRSQPGVGKFMAMQILTDWGYGQDVDRENDFIFAGPGAIKGAKYLNPNAGAGDVIHDLTSEWWGDPSVRLGRHSLSLMDVQNTLCEFSKYARYRTRPPRPQRYNPAHPGPQPAPVLPKWMG